MKKENKIIDVKIELARDESSGQLYETSSVFLGINIARLRYGQLKRGANSRLIGDSPKHKNTSIAVEEVKQGLVAFRFGEEPIV